MPLFGPKAETFTNTFSRNLKNTYKMYKIYFSTIGHKEHI